MRAILRDATKRAVGPVVRWRGLHGALLGRARIRRRSLVLLYHRVGPSGPRSHEVVPTVATDVLRRHIEALGELGDIVPLADIETEPPTARPRFALTFDDDDVGHVQHALPVLTALGVPATFFLSGRWLRGLGPYWWEMLEARIRQDGLRATAADFHRTATTPQGLAVEMTGTADAAQLARVGDAARGEEGMSGMDARALASAGMEIGFHTLHHPVLTSLRGDALDHALDDNRHALAAGVERDLERFSYPHGIVDRRVATRTAQRGYRTGWTTSHRPVVPGDDPHLLGRWEPGGRSVDELVVGALRRLVTPAPA